MGFFDQILNEVTGAVGQSTQTAQPDPSAAGQPAAQADVVQELLGLLTSGGTGGGGLSGLLSTFERCGLGHLAASWVGSGQNLPVTPDQVQSVLGPQQIQELAQRVGVPPGEASQMIASVLPGLIDKLTPNGQVDHGLLAEGLAMLQQRKA